jgi:hypothetical protein
MFAKKPWPIGRQPPRFRGVEMSRRSRAVCCGSDRARSNLMLGSAILGAAHRLSRDRTDRGPSRYSLDIVLPHGHAHGCEQKVHGTTKKWSPEYRSKTPGGAGYTRQTHEPHKHLKTNPTLRLTRQTTPEPRNARVATNHRSPLTRSSAVWW